jgi:phosphoribosylamine--glycine ligase
MKILIIGSGGREHALAWKVAQSQKVSQVFVAPGNPGTQLENKVTTISISATDCEKLLEFALEKAIDLTIVGPEAPLSLGIVDLFEKNHLAIFGPSQAAARLESSKAFCKDFLQKNNIPTAAYQNFTDINAALQYAKNQSSYPIVIKADGLAAGKGVIIAENYGQAQTAICEMLAEKKFGDASQKIVIEEFLHGEELSYIVMVDGKNILPLASSQDHKRLLDNDQGPNTGGMGAYSPAPILTDTLEKTILQKIISPTVRALQKNGTPYTGFLYDGLMISPNGEPKILEYNCRLGDPETQPILMRLESDIIDLFLAAGEKKLHKVDVRWDKRFALAVVMAAGGYPEIYKTGDSISGLDQALPENAKIFHAGTLQKGDRIVTQGGRVLAVTALGESVQDARKNAYRIVEKIRWPDAFYRRDIGHRALQADNPTANISSKTQIFEYHGSENALLNVCAPLLTYIGELKSDTAPFDFQKTHAFATYEIKVMEEYAQKQGIKQDSILAARYLMCAFVDEIIRRKSIAFHEWESKSLLKTFLIEPTQGDQFFHILDKRMSDPKKHLDLLELAYIALSMGYQGNYPAQEVGNYLDRIYEVVREERATKELSALSQATPTAAAKFYEKLPPLWIIMLAGIGFLAIIWLPYHRHLDTRARLISQQLVTIGNLNAKSK